MMYLIGFAMMGGYYALITVSMMLSEIYCPNLKSLFFAYISMAYAAIAMKVQTRVELAFIKRHVERNPGSGWQVVVDANAAKGR